MASTTRTLTVNVVGRTKNVEKAFKRVSKGSALMSDKMMRATRMAGIGFTALAGVAIGAAAALKPMIDKAASMEESLSKNRLMFGEASNAVEQFAEKAGQAFGVSERAALEATGVFGSLGDAMGMSEEASASMAMSLTGLAGDLSSLHDVDVETALTALRAGLIGEAEPLRKLGILLDAATIKSKALAMGLVTSTKDALTPAIKSQAAYALMLEKGETAMGDFARTSDSATNQSKLLAIEWDKIQTEIGTALLPAFTSIVTHLNEVVLPAVRQFWSDPSWYEGGVLAGEVLGSGFVSGATGFLKGLSEEEIDDLGWQESWKASAEISAIVAGVGAAWAFISGARDTLESDPAQMALKAAFEAAGAGAFDRPLDQRGGDGGGTPATDIFNSIADLENAAAAIAAAAAATTTEFAAAPFPGLSQAEIDAMTANAVAAAIEAALAAAATATVTAAEVTTGPDVEQLTAAAGPTDDEVAAWLGSPGAQALFGVGPGVSQLTSGGDTTVIINASAVTAPEVIDLMGKYVQANGPLSRQWIGQ